MARPRKDPLKVKKPVTFGITNETIIAFDLKVKELGLNRSVTVESLMQEFLK